MVGVLLTLTLFGWNIGLMPTFCRVTVNRYDGFYLNSNLAFHNGYKNSEYDQEMPPSQTADNPMVPWEKSHITITRYQEDILSKATISLFPIEMIAKLEGA